MKETGHKLALRSQYRSAEDNHIQRKIEWAFVEWVDADSIASYIAYGIDIFCYDDAGSGDATKSILDSKY